MKNGTKCDACNGRGTRKVSAKRREPCTECDGVGQIIVDLNSIGLPGSEERIAYYATLHRMGVGIFEDKCDAGDY